MVTVVTTVCKPVGHVRDYGVFAVRVVAANCTWDDCRSIREKIDGETPSSAKGGGMGGLLPRSG